MDAKKPSSARWTEPAKKPQYVVLVWMFKVWEVNYSSDDWEAAKKVREDAGKVLGEANVVLVDIVHAEEGMF